jgi:hypothetical protein
MEILLVEIVVSFSDIWYSLMSILLHEYYFRWQTCSDKANSVFGMAISYHYVQDAFSDDFSSQVF